jgi:hypothetical protein
VLPTGTVRSPRRPAPQLSVQKGAPDGSAFCTESWA